MKIYYILFVLINISVNSLFPQNREWYIPQGEGVSVLNHECWPITVDRYNNIFFATIGYGIVKFNWKNWELINKSNSNIPSDDIVDIFFDANNVLWTATRNGVAKYDSESWIKWNSSNSIINDNEIYSICLDSSGGLWASNYYGIYYIKDSSVIYHKYIQIDVSPSIICFATDKSKKVWAGSFMGGLYYYDNSWHNVDRSAFEPIIMLEYSVKALEVDKLGNVWIAPSQGLARYDGEKYKLWDALKGDFPSKNVYDITADNENNIWVGTDSGLVKFDGENTIVYNTDNSPLPSNIINDVAIDSLGHKWISCDLPWLGQTRIIVFREGGTVFTTDVYEEQNSSFTINPNPAKDKAVIQFSISHPTDVDISIYNSLGVNMSDVSYGKIQKGTFTESINTSQYPPGMYYVMLKIGANTYTQKLLVVR